MSDRGFRPRTAAERHYWVPQQISFRSSGVRASKSQVAAEICTEVLSIFWDQSVNGNLQLCSRSGLMTPIPNKSSGAQFESERIVAPEAKRLLRKTRPIYLLPKGRSERDLKARGSGFFLRYNAL